MHFLRSFLRKQKKHSIISKGGPTFEPSPQKKSRVFQILPAGVKLLGFLGLAVPIAYVFYLYFSTDVVVSITLAPGTSKVTGADLEDIANRAAEGAKDSALEISHRFANPTLESLLGWTEHEKDGTYCSRTSFVDLGLVQQIMAASGEGPLIASEDTLNNAVFQAGSLPSMFATLAGFARRVLGKPYKRIELTISDEGDAWQILSRIEHYWDRGEAKGWGVDVYKHSMLVPLVTDIEALIERTILRASYPAISAAGLSHRGTKDMGIEQFFMPSLSSERRVLVLLGSLQALQNDAHLNQAARLSREIEVWSLIYKLYDGFRELSEVAVDRKSRQRWSQLSALMRINWSIATRQIDKRFRPVDLLKQDPIFSIAVTLGLIEPPGQLKGASVEEGEIASDVINEAHRAFVLDASKEYMLSVPEASLPVAAYFLGNPFEPFDSLKTLNTQEETEFPETLVYMLNSILMSSLQSAQFDSAKNKYEYDLLNQEIVRFDRIKRVLSKLHGQPQQSRDFIAGIKLNSIAELALRLSESPTPELELSFEDMLRKVQNLVRSNRGLVGDAHASFIDLAIELQLALYKNDVNFVGSLVDEFDSQNICAAVYLHKRLSMGLKKETLNREEIARHYVRSAQNLINKGVRNFSIYNGLGISLASLGQLDASVAAYQQARRYREGSIAWAYSNESSVHLARGDFQAAVDTARKALSSETENGFDFIAARRNLLAALFMNRDTYGFARAIADYYDTFVADGVLASSVALKGLFPEDVRHILEILACTTGGNVSELLESRGHTNLIPVLTIESCVNASTSYAYSVIKQVQEHAALRPVVKHIEAKRFVEAANAAEDVLSEQPENPEVHVLLGIANRALGKTDLALENFSSGIDYGIDWPIAFVSRAIKYAHSGDMADAYADLRRASKSQPVEEVGLYFRALVELAAGNTDKGIEIMGEVGLAFPNDPFPWLKRARALREAGRLEEALEDLAMSLNKFDGDNTEIMREKENLLQEMERYEEAQ